MQNFPLTQLASGYHGDRELNILYKEQIGPARLRSAGGLRAEKPPALETVAPGATDNRRRQRPRPTASPPTRSCSRFFLVGSLACLCNPLIIPTFLFRSRPGGERPKKRNHLHTRQVGPQARPRKNRRRCGQNPTQNTNVMHEYLNSKNFLF